MVEFDLHNRKSLFALLAKLGFPINYEFRIKSIKTELSGPAWPWSKNVFISFSLPCRAVPIRVLELNCQKTFCFEHLGTKTLTLVRPT